MPPSQKNQGNNIQYSASGYSSLSDELLLQHKGLGKLLSSVVLQYIESLSAKLQSRGFTDIRPVHLRIIREIGLGGVSITEVAAKASVTKQAAGQMVKELSHLGYIRTLIDPLNRRTRTIILTERGTQLVLHIRQAIAEMQELMVDALGMEQFEAMVAGLIRLRESGVLASPTNAASTEETAT